MNTAAGCAHTHFRAAFKQRSSQRLASFTLGWCQLAHGLDGVAYHGLIADLLTVALGIRPCFLNDYFHADIDALQSFLSDLQQAGIASPLPRSC
ncbi:hypothetical protein BC830DRAFT_1149488 [Chytriomyces sp. MP71]|nr:hypothetical protein BC830DRAFT_1149488 [Chytriomyces sp. MP71]